MIKQVLKINPYNENITLNSTEEIAEKLNYYRSLFGKVQDLTDFEFENLKKDIKTFFNTKPIHFTNEAPENIIRVSNNTNVLNSTGKKLGCFTEIEQILAPPIEFCNFNRCNLPQERVLYCALNPATAYWETKPKKGDIITLSYWKKKKNISINCVIIENRIDKHLKSINRLEEVYYLIDEFFIDVFTYEINKNRPRDYIFSALISSEILLNPLNSKNYIDAIIYPSVQKKKYGHNIAIRNDKIFEKYELIGVETRFILDEIPNINPKTNDLISDYIIGSIGTETFNIKKGKILYSKKVEETFDLLRMLQTNGSKQIRYDIPENYPKNLIFNLSENSSIYINTKSEKRRLQRNQKVNVIYENGLTIENVKFKKIMHDFNTGKCKILED